MRQFNEIYFRKHNQGELMEKDASLTLSRAGRNFPFNDAFSKRLRRDMYNLFQNEKLRPIDFLESIKSAMECEGQMEKKESDSSDKDEPHYRCERKSTDEAIELSLRSASSSSKSQRNRL